LYSDCCVSSVCWRSPPSHPRRLQVRLRKAPSLFRYREALLPLPPVESLPLSARGPLPEPSTFNDSSTRAGTDGSRNPDRNPDEWCGPDTKRGLPHVSALVTAATASCPILSLTLGPLHLDLLGLVIDLNQINLNITAQPGPGNLLGNLLCDVANLLNSNGGALTSITNLLNQILAGLGL
jgi:hypothetical protein